jgi:hypothetical protein
VGLLVKHNRRRLAHYDGVLVTRGVMGHRVIVFEYFLLSTS